VLAVPGPPAVLVPGGVAPIELDIAGAGHAAVFDPAEEAALTRDTVVVIAVSRSQLPAAGG
jgi:hypothetical protein